MVVIENSQTLQSMPYVLYSSKKSLARRKRIAQDINMSIQTLNVVKDALGSNLML